METAEIVDQVTLKSLFKNRNYMFLLISTFFSAPGYYIYLIAAEWMMLTLSDNRFYFGLLFIAAAVPRLLFMLVGGIIADRFNKRTILFISDLTRALLTLFLVVFIMIDAVTVWHLIVLAGLFGIADAISYPVTSSLIPTILAEHELQKGNSLIQVSGLLSPIFGAAIGGTLIAISGFQGVFTVAFVMLLIASIIIMLIRVKHETIEEAKTPWEDLKEGFHYVKNNEFIISIVFLALVLNFFFTGPIAMGLPIIVKDVFLGNSINLAIIESAMGIGALIGVIVLVSISIKNSGVRLILMVVGVGILYMGLGFSNNFYITVGLVVMMSFLLQLVNIPIITALQRTTDKKMLGRTMSLFMLVSTGLIPISFLVTSTLISIGVGIQTIMIGGGAIVTIFAYYNLRNKSITTMKF